MNIVSPGGITKITSLSEISDNLITNAKINSSAAIDYTKMSALTVDAAVNTSASGFLEVGTTTNETELGYINSLSSNAQTQITSKGNGTVANIYLSATSGAAIGGATVDASTGFSAVNPGIYPVTHLYNSGSEQTGYTIPISTNIGSIDSAYVALNHDSTTVEGCEYTMMVRLCEDGNGIDYGSSGSKDVAVITLDSGGGGNFIENNAWYYFDVSGAFDGLDYGDGIRALHIRGGLSGHSTGNVYFGGLYLTVVN